MDVTTAIRTRRSIRKYKKKEIPENVLKEVLEAARLAPSAANRQAWELVVVKDPKLKAELVPVCKNQKFVEDCSVFLAGLEDPEQKWSKVDITIMMDHMTLAAHEKGLGTCWICNFDARKCSRILEIPAHIEPMVYLPLGYPADEEKNSPRHKVRKKMEEIVRRDKF